MKSTTTTPFGVNGLTSKRRQNILTIIAVLTGTCSGRVVYDSTTDSTFQIYSPDEAAPLGICNMHASVTNKMKANGFTQVMCPFGILMMANEDYPPELLKYGANMIANMVDNDNDGVADDDDVLSHLAHNGVKGHGKAMMCGTTRSTEQKESEFSSQLNYVFSCQTWKSTGDKDLRGIMFEETFHLVQDGWAYVHPTIFGLDDFTSSVICREAARLQCVEPGWWHPENKCPKGAPFEPGSPADSPLQPGDGDCTDANCDCAEFYRQAATLYMGWDSGSFWYSDYMPETKSAFIDMASEEMLDAMSNKAYHQPQEPLSGIYTHKEGVQGTDDVSDDETGTDDAGDDETGTDDGEGECEDSEEKIEVIIKGSTKTKPCVFFSSAKGSKYCSDETVSTSCPVSCGTCDDEGGDDETGTDDGEVDDGDGECEDSEEKIEVVIKGSTKTKPCEFFTSAKGSEYCSDETVSTSCPVSCGTCDDEGDDETGTDDGGEVDDGDGECEDSEEKIEVVIKGSTKTKPCEFFTSAKGSEYCSDETVSTSCPVSCGTCDDEGDDETGTDEDTNVLCPGQPAANYCDCSGDCTNEPDWCSCADAQACCDGGGNEEECEDSDEKFEVPINGNLRLKPCKFFGTNKGRKFCESRDDIMEACCESCTM